MLLYHNNGDGTFTDVTEKAGIRDPNYYGFGVLFSDFDNDGWPDIYVANDSQPNLMFHNKRDGTFSEVGLLSGWLSTKRAEPSREWVLRPATTTVTATWTSS